MKRIIFILFTFVLLCSGCQTKEDTSALADNSEFDLEAKYNITQGSISSQSRDILETEDSILVLISAEKKIEEEIPSILGYLDKNSDEIMFFNKNAASLCTPEEPSSCSGVFFNNTLNYYKGHLYYLDQNYDWDTDTMTAVLNRCDIDGRNKETIYTFDLSNVNVFTGSWTSPFIEFHKNKIYVQLLNKFYYGDVDSLDIKEIALDGVKNIDKLCICNDVMYFYTERYDDGNEVHFDAVLECDLEGNIKQVLYEDMLFAFMDKDNVFYYSKDLTEDEYPDGYYMINRETNEVKRVADYAFFILRYKDTYLLDTSDMDNKNSKILILNKEGDVLLEKSYQCESDQLAQIFTGNRYYVWKDGRLGYYEITDEGISDLILFSYQEG